MLYLTIFGATLKKPKSYNISPSPGLCLSAEEENPFRRMTLKLDAIDCQIVDLLTQDGRMACADMARAIGSITERMVRYRLERLIARGIITVSAIVDPKKIGYPVIADVLIEVEPGQVMQLAAQLAAYETVTYVACSTGRRDISIQLVAHDNHELYDFVIETIGRLPGVRRTSTSLVPLIVKDDARWRIPSTVLKPSTFPGRARATEPKRVVLKPDSPDERSSK